jgi:hypothetical protein
MTRTFKLTILAMLILTGGATLASTASRAAAHWPTYHFESVDQTIHAGQGVTVSVRLIQAATGKAITDATITDAKLLMMMGKMEPMPAPVKMLTPDANGNYPFACDVIEPGDWELDLSAQIPNEQKPVNGAIKFNVVK